MAIIKEADITEGIDTPDSEQQLQIPGELPVLPLRDPDGTRRTRPFESGEE